MQSWSICISSIQVIFVMMSLVYRILCAKLSMNSGLRNLQGIILSLLVMLAPFQWKWKRKLSKWWGC
ncbi:BnaC09g42320D [Brassica napus]|uniref:BnaC09g42320D protein n=2 Tax=Brassica TaxID=3705 RepID=A0A078GM85_BRANA|nr:BnaC09g42320D [Brassica napus]VDD33673.1 unnamed protein product [Brassica oleracea]